MPPWPKSHSMYLRPPGKMRQVVKSSTKKCPEGDGGTCGRVVSHSTGHGQLYSFKCVSSKSSVHVVKWMALLYYWNCTMIAVGFYIMLFASIACSVIWHIECPLKNPGEWIVSLKYNCQGFLPCEWVSEWVSDWVSDWVASFSSHDWLLAET